MVQEYSIPIEPNHFNVQQGSVQFSEPKPNQERPLFWAGRTALY